MIRWPYAKWCGRPVQYFGMQRLDSSSMFTTKLPTALYANWGSSVFCRIKIIGKSLTEERPNFIGFTLVRKQGAYLFLVFDCLGYKKMFRGNEKQDLFNLQNPVIWWISGSKIQIRNKKKWATLKSRSFLKSWPFWCPTYGFKFWKTRNFEVWTPVWVELRVWRLLNPHGPAIYRPNRHQIQLSLIRSAARPRSPLSFQFLMWPHCIDEYN